MIPIHVREEEKMRTASMPEWIRRNDPKFTGELNAFPLTMRLIGRP